jgi:hypothetical protein
MAASLITKAQAAENIAAIVTATQPLTLEVREDICFDQNAWVAIGQVHLNPSSTPTPTEASYDPKAAIAYGGFEWDVPDQDQLKANLSRALDTLEEKHRPRVEKAFLQALQDVVRRTLLLFPVFDIATMSGFPLKRPTTIVPDTNAIHQGALDFATRFLTPWARLKLPAIVHMEILNKVDSYFGIRRKTDGPPKAASRAAVLENHVLGQGGQRTLLRVELHSDAEMERGDLGADPLRGIVTESSDPEDKHLGLQTIVRSFADRLIVETARRFHTQVRPDHPLAILTSDQGMARMAMAEGLGVFFFQARSVPRVEGQTLTGTLFHPFSAAPYTVSLVDVLWELAVSFGAARLSNPATGKGCEAWGIPRDTDTSWQPLHATDDLLWCRLPEPELMHTIVGQQAAVGAEVADTEPGTAQTRADQVSTPSLGSKPLTGSYAFSPNRLFGLIDQLVAKGSLSEDKAKQALNIENRDQYKRYENFLLSGDMIARSETGIIAKDGLRTFYSALIERNLPRVLEHLNRVPSFRLLYDYVHARGIASQLEKEFPIPQRATGTYLALGEAAGAWLQVPEIGIVATSRTPEDAAFASAALAAYVALSSAFKSEWVLTGDWLERLATEEAIHPACVPQLLESCKQRRLLKLYAEGSTPDTRFDLHRMWLLRVTNKRPLLGQVYLYHGDFVLPNTAAVRLKVVRVD